MTPKGTILIVEDDQMIITAYKMILEHDGFRVLTAGDGQQGLQIAAKENPDLIILDILMPVMGGVEFLQQYKPKEHPKTKVLVLSNSSSPEKLKACQDLGASEYLIKTEVKPEQVKIVVKGLIAGNKQAGSNVL